MHMRKQLLLSYSSFTIVFWWEIRVRGWFCFGGKVAKMMRSPPTLNVICDVTSVAGWACFFTCDVTSAAGWD